MPSVCRGLESAANDVVSMQLPNWWQFTLTYLACSRIGAVLNPLMHIFRERELSFMLKHGASKVVIVPKQFRGFDYEQMIAGLKPSLPDLQHVIVVGGAGDNSFEKLLSNPASTSYPVHMMCRREHITHYENLANLDQVVNTRFTFAGFPLKLRGAHGGPTRAVALVS